MQLITDARRWIKPITSAEVYPKEPIRELRLEDTGRGVILIYVNGRPEPATHVEPMFEGGGERVFILGDHEEYQRPHKPPTDAQRNLMQACVERYLVDLQMACMEDQGVRAGRPGTIGNDVQNRLKDLREYITTL